jgi:hypothetical protein
MVPSIVSLLYRFFMFPCPRPLPLFSGLHDHSCVTQAITVHGKEVPAGATRYETVVEDNLCMVVSMTLD